jgi:hypothetical protein
MVLPFYRSYDVLRQSSECVRVFNRELLIEIETHRFDMPSFRAWEEPTAPICQRKIFCYRPTPTLKSPVRWEPDDADRFFEAATALRDLEDLGRGGSEVVLGCNAPPRRILRR